MYSLDDEEVLEKCKSDNDFLGEAILHNEKLIWFAINKYCGNPTELVKMARVDKDDLLQQGRIALINSIRSFNIRKGLKFSSLAVVAIQREVNNFIRDKTSIIRKTRSAHILNIKIKQIEEVLGYLPNVEKLAEILNENEREIEKILSVGRNEKFVGDKIEIEDSRSYSFEESLINDYCFNDYVKKISADFIGDEKQVFLLLIEGKTQAQIANEIGQSKNIVRKHVDKVRSVVTAYTKKESIKGGRFFE